MWSINSITFAGLIKIFIYHRYLTNWPKVMHYTHSHYSFEDFVTGDSYGCYNLFEKNVHHPCKKFHVTMFLDNVLLERLQQPKLSPGTECSKRMRDMFTAQSFTLVYHTKLIHLTAVALFTSWKVIRGDLFWPQRMPLRHVTWNILDPSGGSGPLIAEKSSSLALRGDRRACTGESTMPSGAADTAATVRKRLMYVFKWI